MDDKANEKLSLLQGQDASSDPVPPLALAKFESLGRNVRKFADAMDGETTGIGFAELLTQILNWLSKHES